MNGNPRAPQSDRLLILECGAAMTRAALIIDGETIRFWFGPARGDEASEPACDPGRRYTARVKRIDHRLGAAFADIGAAADGFLPLQESHGLSEGALAAVIIKRSPRGQKGATLSLADHKPGEQIVPVDDAPDAAIQAVQALGEDAKLIITDSGAAKAVIGAQFPSREIVHEGANLFERCGGAEALETALSRSVSLAAGGRIVIEETEALTAIDVDSGGAEASSSNRLRERVNLDAAKTAALELSKRDIGGNIVIDFLPLSGAARNSLNNMLKASFPTAQKASWTKSGLFSFVLPRPRQSLRERFMEETADGGRRFSADFLARNAICKLEEGLRASRSSAFMLKLGRELGACLKTRPQWGERIAACYGARFEIRIDDEMEGCGFELSEQ